MSGSCAALSRAAGEPLAGTASPADAFLVLEVRGAWGRDVVEGAALSDELKAHVRAWLERTPRSKLLLVRRPDRRAARGFLAFLVRAAEGRAGIRRLELARHDDLLAAALDVDGDPVSHPLVLICAHGRRDRCCARYGPPLFDALRDRVGRESLWLSSHQGGHRFAANLLWLPDALSFGRVPPEQGPALLRALLAGRLPVAHLRGRTTFPPEAQAAEIAVRERLGLTGIGDVRLAAVDGDRVVLATPSGDVTVTVERSAGEALPPSCGAAPEAALHYRARL